MKYRIDYVTNSSSSSFIITNNSDHCIDSEDLAKMLFEKIFEDAKSFDMKTLKPGESCTVECSDHIDDNAMEAYIHDQFCDRFSVGKYFKSDDVSIKFKESHH